MEEDNKKHAEAASPQQASLDGAENQGEDIKKYVEAARVASSIREFAEDLIKPGMKMAEIAEKIEAEIASQGAEYAFPVNLSVNEEAAHDTAKIGDERVLGEKDLLKVDIGVHIDGYIIDQAFTFSASNEHEKLIEASKQALEDAISVIRVGKTTKDAGQAIYDAITSRGFKPIENLCGHALAPYLVHAGVSVPNIPKGDYVFEEGDVFAIEPFATTGAGKVEDGSFTEIYSLFNPKGVRLPQSRKAMDWIAEKRQTLPFAKRHLLGALGSETSTELALRDLVRQGILQEYPVLVEINKGLVSQAETTVIVELDGVKVLV